MCGQFECDQFEAVEEAPVQLDQDLAEPERPECSCAMSEASLANCAVHGYDAPAEETLVQLDRDLAELEGTDPAVGEAAARLDATAAAIVAKARVERERDELAEQLKASRAEGVQLATRIYEMQGELVSARQERDEAIRERDEMVARKARMQRDLDAQLAEAREQLAVTNVAAWRAEMLGAELSSARQELEQLRGVRDDLAAAEERIRVLEHGEAVDDDLARTAAANVLERQHRYRCEACGARYGKPYPDHEHGPLTPVTVLIIREQGAPPA